MTAETNVLEIFQRLKVRITDSHFVYSSWRHGADYIDKDAIYLHPEETLELCRQLAEGFRNDRVDGVIGPALGGIVLSQWTAHHLTALTGKKVFSLYAEKVTHSGSGLWYLTRGIHLLSGGRTPVFGQASRQEFALTRGQGRFVNGKRMLVVEDVLTTGASARKVSHLVKSHGGHVVGVGALCNRGQVTANELGVPKLHCLVDLHLETWSSQDCPLCSGHVPINTEYGRGRELLASQKK